MNELHSFRCIANTNSINQNYKEIIMMDINDNNDYNDIYDDKFSEIV